MGQGSSLPDIPGGGTDGYHVLRIQDNSPGQKAGLESYFDYIVSLDNVRLKEDNEQLRDILKKYENHSVVMTVYSSKYQQCRHLTLHPNGHWGGQGLLGVSIRFTSFEEANKHVWHVMEVSPSSPAEVAGLDSGYDYIIGSDVMINEPDDFWDMVETANGKPLKLFVYNTRSDRCREVEIIPNSKWGGDGLLGCELGYGYLHRIPRQPVPLTSVRAETTRVGPPTADNVEDGFSEVSLGVPSQPTTPHHQPQATIDEITTNVESLSMLSQPQQLQNQPPPPLQPQPQPPLVAQPVLQTYLKEEETEEVRSTISPHYVPTAAAPYQQPGPAPTVQGMYQSQQSLYTTAYQSLPPMTTSSPPDAASATVTRIAPAAVQVVRSSPLTLPQAEITIPTFPNPLVGGAAPTAVPVGNFQTPHAAPLQAAPHNHPHHDLYTAGGGGGGKGTIHVPTTTTSPPNNGQ